MHNCFIVLVFKKIHNFWIFPTEVYSSFGNMEKWAGGSPYIIVSKLSVPLSSPQISAQVDQIPSRPVYGQIRQNIGGVHDMHAGVRRLTNLIIIAIFFV